MSRRPAGGSRFLARIVPVAVALAAAALLLAMQAAPAAAHEGRRIGGYNFLVGFGEEPAYAGTRNSAQVIITDAAGRPVTELGDQLNVMVMTGGKAMTLKLEPNFEVGEWGTPGDFRAFFVPTVPGRYTFHLRGKVGGQKVDQPFTSGPKTFGDVEDPAKVAFPTRDPSTGQLAQRLDRELPRLSAALQAATTRERSVRHAADQARQLALAGILLGVVGLVVGALATARARRRPVAPATLPGVAVGAGKP
jgi:hypothetical protein